MIFPVISQQRKFLQAPIAHDGSAQCLWPTKFIPKWWENAVDVYWTYGNYWRFMDAWELIKVSTSSLSEAQEQIMMEEGLELFAQNGHYRAVRITEQAPAFPPLRCRSYSAPVLSRSYWLPTHQQRPAENTALKAQDLPQNLRPLIVVPGRRVLRFRNEQLA